MKGLVGGAATGPAQCRKHWTTALIPRSSGQDAHPSNAERAQATEAAWSGGRYKAARSAAREQGRSKTGIASLPHDKLAPMRAPGHTGDKTIWMPSLPSQVQDREEDFSEFSTSSLKWATERSQKNVASYLIRSSRS